MLLIPSSYFGLSNQFLPQKQSLSNNGWQRNGITGQQYASLTDIITKEWSDRTTKEYKQLKGLKKESLRDNMTNVELALNTLAEAATTEISKNKNPKGYKQNVTVAQSGGSVAKAAREQLESKLGYSVISSAKAKDYLLPEEKDDNAEQKDQLML